MSEPSDRRQRSLMRNPFSPTAVARVSESASDMVSVPTPAIQEAIRYLDEYLSSGRADGRPRAGNVVAITGDYGTGKTHLAAMLVNHARNRAETFEEDPDASRATSSSGRDGAEVVYLDAANETFLSLYRRFVNDLPRDEVYSRIREYYADIVAGHLTDTELADRARSVIRDYDLDVADTVSRLGLPESSLLRELREKLKDVTDNDAFAVVLSLLLRPGFDDSAWEWLRAGRAEPHPLLVERGVTSVIDDDVSALEAFGVFALLYGLQNRRFVLIIDELNKLLPMSDPPSHAALLAFRKLLTVFVGARALLVLVGLEESFDLLEPDTRQRIGAFVPMSRFDRDATIKFIEKCQRRVFGSDQLWPFSEEVADRIVALTEGNPRKVVLYCRHLFRMSIQEAGDPKKITREMVHEAARKHFGIDTRKRVDAAVGRALGGEGWETLRDYSVDALNGLQVDFWIPVSGEATGCAIFLTTAVIDDSDVERLRTRAEAVRAVTDECEMLLVVSEALAPQHVAALTDAFGRAPLVYHPHSFEEDLVAAVKPMKYRIEQLVGGDALVLVQERVARISQQHSGTLRLLEGLMRSLRELRVASDQGLGSVRHALDDMIRVVLGTRGAEPGVPVGEQPPILPDRVNQLFDEGLIALETLGTETEVVGDAFLIDAKRRTSAAEEAAARVRTVTRPPDVLAAVGSAALLRTTTEAFRRGVGEWFRSCVPTDRKLRTSDVQKLEALCETYDAIYEDLPLFPLVNLARLKDQSTSSDDMEEITSWDERISDVKRQFEYLGVEIRQAVLNSFPR